MKNIIAFESRILRRTFILQINCLSILLKDAFFYTEKIWRISHRNNELVISQINLLSTLL